MSHKPEVEIEYCPKCGWLLRAAWLSQELLSTFSDELRGVALRPSAQAGSFQVKLDGQLVWCRKRDGGFPQAAELKRRVRDLAAPERALGHGELPHATDTEPRDQPPRD